MPYQLLYELKCPKGFSKGFKTVQCETLEEAKAVKLSGYCYKQIKNTDTEEIIEEWGEIRGSLNLS